jgi:hypothetical protein
MAIINKKETFTSVVPPKEHMSGRPVEVTEEWTPPPPTLHIDVHVSALEAIEVGGDVEFKARGTLVSKENRKTRRGQQISYGIEVKEIAI